MKEKLLSRKFWVVIASFATALTSLFADVDVDPEALVGFAGIVMSYLIGQSWVDKAAASKAVEDGAAGALAAAEAYARALEAQLADAGQET